MMAEVVPKQSIKVPTVKLNDGRQMPMLALGTYSRTLVPELCKSAVTFALENGYTHIDTAVSYYNEVEVGDAIKQYLNDCGRRQDLWITTKLGNDSHGRDEVVPALRKSLERLSLEYVDLYLIHWPVSTNDENTDLAIDLMETWQGMEEARRLGLARSIGVSNFNQTQLEYLLKNAEVIPAVNQIEISINMRQEKLVKYCHSNGICPMAYTPLGLLSNARPEFMSLDDLTASEILNTIAERYSKSKAQVALRYLIDRGLAVAVKSFTRSRILENIGIFDFVLDKQDLEQLYLLNKDLRLVPAEKFRHLNNYPF